MKEHSFDRVQKENEESQSSRRTLICHLFFVLNKRIDVYGVILTRYEVEVEGTNRSNISSFEWETS